MFVCFHFTHEVWNATNSLGNYPPWEGEFLEEACDGWILVRVIPKSLTPHTLYIIWGISITKNDIIFMEKILLPLLWFKSSSNLYCRWMI
jgi:hypothetical protein